MKSRDENFIYTPFSAEELLNKVSLREGEKRLGENIVSEEPKKFVIIGVEESVGPVANLGKAGAEQGFDPFVSTFLNIQANRFLLGKAVTIAGKISCLNKFSDIKRNRVIVEELDEFV